MGKVKRLRKKYHLACQKSESLDAESTPEAPAAQTLPGRTELPVKLDDSNIFAGVTISFSDLEQTLLPTPTPVLGSVSEASVICSKSGKATKHIPKKEKRLARRETLLRKIDTVNKLRREAKEAMKHKNAPPPKPMLMQSLIDALPLFDLAGQEGSSKTSAKRDKSKRVKTHSSKQKRKRDYLENLKAFKSVLANDHYQADPVSAISNFISRTVPKISGTNIKKKKS